jgi:Flp pilus assembly protein TadG
MIPAAIVFLLFFAILAFAWFYLQRAKLRDAGKTATSDPVKTEAPAPTDPAP